MVFVFSIMWVFNQVVICYNNLLNRQSVWPLIPENPTNSKVALENAPEIFEKYPWKFGPNVFLFIFCTSSLIEAYVVFNYLWNILTQILGFLAVPSVILPKIYKILWNISLKIHYFILCSRKSWNLSGFRYVRSALKVLGL